MSKLGRDHIPDAHKTKLVFAYHEIVERPETADTYVPDRCDVYYNARYSPDFYAWVFPARQNRQHRHRQRPARVLPSAMPWQSLRNDAGLGGSKTIRKEGAPIPLKPLKRWDNGRDVLLAGMPRVLWRLRQAKASIMPCWAANWRLTPLWQFLATSDARALAQARKRFMRAHGMVFRILAVMQHFWYGNDKRRERFVTMCRDKDVQRLTWAAYTEKKMQRANPAGPCAHLREGHGASAGH